MKIIDRISLVIFSIIILALSLATTFVIAGWLEIDLIADFAVKVWQVPEDFGTEEEKALGDYFEKQGEAIKVRGGARSMKYITTSMEENIVTRSGENTLSKQKIANAAASAIE